MFKKAYRYDDETVFYFDEQDNKYVAKGANLTWRLNNPGLLPSRSLAKIKCKIIGTHHQYAIFPDFQMGKNALRSWMRSSKYFDSSLKEIAKHYQSGYAESYLKQLCELTGLTSQTKLSSLSSIDFEKLLNAIQKLAGFSFENDHPFSLLPKITAKFHSKDRTIESYLVGYETILSKQEAIQWIESHELDAVIVHRKEGDVYLRSRPGHHFNQIHFQQEEYGSNKEFKDAFRNVGTEEPEQCVWGFINGISNSAQQALQSANLISKHANGERVWSLVNDAKFLGNLIEAAAQKLNYRSEVVKFGVQFLKFLIELSDQSPLKPPIVVFAHSQGALIIDLALDGLKSEERNRIHIYTFGGAAFIPPGKSHPNTLNNISIADPIPRIAMQGLVKVLLRIYEGEKMGHNSSQVVAQLIQEDIDAYVDTQNQTVVDEFKNQRQQQYENALEKSLNISIIDENISSFWEHSFAIPCYQEVVRKIINQYRQK